MKIAIFHNLPSGGAKRMASELIRELSKRHTIGEFSLTTSSKILNTDKTNCKRVFRYSAGKSIFTFVLKGLFLLPFVHKKIANEINHGGYDLVLVNHDYIVKSPYILRYLKIPSFYFCHEPPREFYEQPYLHSPLLKDKIANLIRFPFKIIDNQNIKFADLVISNSIYSRKIIKKTYNIDSTIIYPGVDTIIFRPTKLKKKNQLISIGSLLRYKGHIDVIDAISTINEEVKPALVIVGDGRETEKDKIVRHAIARNVNVTILKHQSDKKLSILYSSSKAVVSMAYGEPFGLSIIEGMSCGIPAVVVSEGGLKEQVVTGKTGYISSRNAAEFGSKITKVITDPRYGKRARNDVVKNWSWSRTAEKLEKIINSNYGEN